MQTFEIEPRYRLTGEQRAALAEYADCATHGHADTETGHAVAAMHADIRAELANPMGVRRYTYNLAFDVAETNRRARADNRGWDCGESPDE